MTGFRFSIFIVFIMFALLCFISPGLGSVYTIGDFEPVISSINFANSFIVIEVPDPMLNTPPTFVSSANRFALATSST